MQPAARVTLPAPDVRDPVEPRADGLRAEPRITKIIGPPSFSLAALGGNLAELYRHRDLLITLTNHRVKVRFKQSVLGLGWAIIQPVTLMLVYTAIFSVVAKVPHENVPYSLFVFTALLPWTFFQTSLSTAAGGLVSHTHLITKVYFPREILPLTYVFAALFDFATASLVLISMMAYFRIVPGVEILYVVPVMAVAVVLATAFALALSSFQVQFRDIGIAMPLFLQLWMFATPVVYPLAQVPARYRPFYILNPMAGVVEGFRRVTLQHMAPDMQALGVSAAVALIFLVISYLYFKRRESTMADII